MSTNLCSGDLVLVTGGTGYVGTHVIFAYLNYGYRVRATSSTQVKVDAWKAKWENSVSACSVEWLVTGDNTISGSYDEAVRNVVGISHCAGPYYLEIKNAEELINPQIQGTLNLLKATAKSPSVKRVILNSSMAAMQDIDKGLGVGMHVSADTWGPGTLETAMKRSSDGVYAYFTAKKLGEEAAWAWMKDNSPRTFDLVSVNPASCFGPPLQAFGSLRNLDAATKRFYSYLSGQKKDLATPYPTWVATKDVAKVHVLALTTPVAGGKRFLTTAGKYANAFWVQRLREEFPEKCHSLPEVKPEWLQYVEQYTVDTTPAETILGMKWTPMSDAVRESATYLWEVEAQEKKGGSK